jgi:hypothetical protein
VCTQMTTHGYPGLEGFFVEEDRPLEADERLRFALDECGPDFAADAAPPLPFSGARLVKARRNYAVQYIRVALPELQGLFEPGSGRELGRQAAELLGVGDRGRDSFADFLAAMLHGCGDEPSIERRARVTTVSVPALRILAGSTTEDLRSGTFDSWSGLWKGALMAHDRHLRMRVERPSSAEGAAWRWIIDGD